MQSINYWKQFENTGKIEDYLNYRSYAAVPGENAAEREKEGAPRTNPYAGIHICDRNDIEAGTYRGI